MFSEPWHGSFLLRNRFAYQCHLCSTCDAATDLQRKTLGSYGWREKTRSEESCQSLISTKFGSGMKKQVRRSFSACWTCRRRRVRCDGGHPCTPCTKRKVTCEGYHVELSWVDPDTGAYKSHSRRTLDLASTWEGWPVYGERQLDHLLDEHDGDTCDCVTQKPHQNPFGTLDFEVGDKVEPLVSKLRTPSLPRALTVNPIRDHSIHDQSLFHNYTQRIAFLMIPVDGAVNPWKTTYPAIALQQSSPAHKSLYHAVLAQSAFHLYNVHPSGSDISKFNRRKGLEHYVNSLVQLRTCLNTPSPDYEACVAALLTIAVVEGVYASETKQWRCHFQGAIGFITDFMQQTPWLVSRDAWTLSQSLVLSFEVAQTSRTMIENRPTIIDDLCEAVSLQSNFGYTIGASRDVLYALSTIRKLRIQLMKKEEIHQDQFTAIVEDLIRTLSSEKLDALPPSLIEECDTTEQRSEYEQKSEKKNNYLQVLHRRIFRNAALIYLYRTIFNAVPAIIEQYISRALADTVEFLDLHGGSVSAWPVFMAAVEACSEMDRANATKWLTCSCALGIQNRHAIREIVESVWRERDAQAVILNTAPDQVEVDWTQVQQALKIDLLLI